MINPEKIARINFLAKKQRSEGLTPAEKSEQDTLRREYIDAVKNNLRMQLESVQPSKCENAPHSHKGCNCGCHDHHDHKH